MSIADANQSGTSEPGSTQTLGRYDLCAVLATGGMATVYLAVARGAGGFEKCFAVKCIHPHLAAEQEFVEMFLDEARIASLIQHPNVCSVLDFGESGGTFFLTMEYLMGESLDRVLQRLERISPAVRAARVPPLAARIIADACEGLHAAHELRDPEGTRLNVVHRDVSPQNLFLSYDGTVRVVDFGVASASCRVHHTEPGFVKGKFAYMAPEQMRGATVDRRADVWSLGVVLWEMIAGRSLFRRANPNDTILAAVRAPIPSLSSVVPGVSPGLAAIVDRALRRAPEERYETARALGQALCSWLSVQDRPIAAGDIAELVVEIFPRGPELKRQMLCDALSASSAPAVVDSTPPESSAPRSALESMPAERRGPGWLATALSAVAFAAGCAALAVGIARDPAIADVGLPAPAFAPAQSLSARAAPAVPMPTPQPAPGKTLSPSAPEWAPGAAEISPLPTAEPSSLTPPETPAPSEERRERRRAEWAPTGSGLVSIATAGGWAEVYLRGQYLGLTPGRFSLPAGRHMITLRPGDGSDSRRVRVNVRPDREQRVRVELAP